MLTFFGIGQEVITMMKIKVSYERQEELIRVVSLLQPLKVSVRKPKTEKGAYKRAYITVK